MTKACEFKSSGPPDALDALDTMAPSFAATIESIQRQKASKWLLHCNHLAALLSMTVDELNEFFLRIRNGGTGVRRDGTWTVNPAPFDGKLDLTTNEENLLNLHVVDSGCKHSEGSSFESPSPEVIERSCRYVRVGRSIKRATITVKLQREIARYVIGTHRTLQEYFPAIADRRTKTWRLWADGDVAGDVFHKLDLPYIASYFGSIWDAPVPQGVAPKDISPTVLDLVKHEIIELLVCMFVLPTSNLDSTMIRRSR